jgi:hypothetical protein
VSALAIEVVEPESLPLTSITRDHELACRAAGVSNTTAGEYREAMLAGATFPPVIVFLDSKGVHWLADGFHRCAAAELAGLPAIAADVRQGSRKDALLYAARANSSHGLRRTTADKRRSVLLVLGAYPKWSNRKIGEACGVDDKTVAAARRATESPGAEIPHAEGAESPASPAPNLDRIVARLSRSLDKVLEAWPSERRGDLRTRLLEVCTEPEQ